jgi:lipopolysaccharide transport system permease protein
VTPVSGPVHPLPPDLPRAAAPPRPAKPAPDGDVRWVRMAARPGWQPIDFRELWDFREMVWFLALREVKVRYKQTALGVAWVLLQPFLTMVVFSIFFGRLAGIPSEGVPYPVFTFCALLPWQLFAGGMSGAANSLVQNQALITKVYFPRIAIPLASVATALTDFAVGLLMLAALMAWYGVAPTAAVVTLPAFLLLALAAALAAGLWLAALNVRYRDVRYTIPFLVQLWLIATPVAYPASLVPERWRWAYGLNPMAGVVEGFRWALLGRRPPGPMLWVSVAATAVLLVGGAYYFRRVERSFADVV